MRQESLLKCVCAAAFMFSHSNIDLLCSLQYYFSEYHSELCHKYKTQSKLLQYYDGKTLFSHHHE